MSIHNAAQCWKRNVQRSDLQLVLALITHHRLSLLLVHILNSMKMKMKRETRMRTLTRFSPPLAVVVSVDSQNGIDLFVHSWIDLPTPRMFPSSFVSFNCVHISSTFCTAMAHAFRVYCAFSMIILNSLVLLRLLLRELRKRQPRFMYRGISSLLLSVLLHRLKWIKLLILILRLIVRHTPNIRKGRK